MNVGILAAGEGSRLRAGGFHMPKPLLPLVGVPLIGRLLRAVQPLRPEAIVCIINNQGTSVADYVLQHYPTLPIQFVRQDTASSYESFTVLCAHLRGSPFLVTTVDSVFPPAFLPQFVAAASQYPDMDMMLSVTTFIDDEKPLHVHLDERQRIVQLGDAARDSAYVTSGFYYCSPRISAACAALAPTRVSALREFLGWLLQQGYWLHGYLAPKTIDVDRPQDIAVAEQFIQEFEHPPAPAPFVSFPSGRGLGRGLG
jgi:NDP-sugar pyrophosphorylase family protein